MSGQPEFQKYISTINTKFLAIRVGFHFNFIQQIYVTTAKKTQLHAPNVILRGIFVVKKSDELDEFISSVVDKLKPFGDFKHSDDFHISLSRTFVLKHHWIDSFVNSVRSALQSTNR